MASAKTVYRCQQCGHESLKWLGKCPQCGTWGSLLEEAAPQESKPTAFSRSSLRHGDASPVRLSAVDVSESPRIATGITELDRVLGGGFVPASVVLLAGEPGVGKSTLVLQALAAIGSAEHPVLYVSGEESMRQVKLRADRLSIPGDGIVTAMETDADTIIRTASQGAFPLIAVDSVQTAADPMLDSLPGSISQVRQVANRLLTFAKEHNVCVLLVGHVTKEGAVAGPRVLEHIVDAVLLFEGDGGYPYRVLRAMKNRFGSTNEVGIFEMKASGLAEVANPSALFLAERPQDSAGSSVVVTVEGTRPLLVEVQALATHSGLSSPRRTAIGVDRQRVSMLAAILEKKAGIETGDYDLYVNVAGGFRITEPACDLGVCAALASSYIDRPVPRDMVIIGEVGLTGEVRSVPRLADRLREARRLGFSQAMIPATSMELLKQELGDALPLAVRPVQDVARMMDEIF